MKVSSIGQLQWECNALWRHTEIGRAAPQSQSAFAHLPIHRFSNRPKHFTAGSYSNGFNRPTQVPCWICWWMTECICNIFWNVAECVERKMKIRLKNMEIVGILQRKIKLERVCSRNRNNMTLNTLIDSTLAKDAFCTCTKQCKVNEFNCVKSEKEKQNRCDFLLSVVFLFLFCFKRIKRKPLSI